MIRYSNSGTEHPVDACSALTEANAESHVTYLCSSAYTFSREFLRCSMATGKLQIQVTSELRATPVEDAVIDISSTGEPDQIRNRYHKRHGNRGLSGTGGDHTVDK